jgi:hypothetical protein
MELSVDLSRGVFYGYIDSAVAADPAFGSGLSTPIAEVTAPGPYSWY